MQYSDPNIYQTNNKIIINSSVADLERHQTEARMSADHDFAFFNILHPISKPAVVYSVCNTSKMRHIGNIIARLWTRPVTLDNFRCEQCSKSYQEQLVHILCECSNTATHRDELFRSLSATMRHSDVNSLTQLDSVSQTLKLLGAPIEPIFEEDDQRPFLEVSYPYIVKALRTFFHF